MKKFPQATQEQIVKYVETLNAEFGNDQRSYEISTGRKYVRINVISWGQTSVHSFVDGEGKIWKPATWKAPATNFSRGSIFNENCDVGMDKPACEYSAM